MRLSVPLIALLILFIACGGGDSQADYTKQASLPVDTLAIIASFGEELGDSTNTFGVVGDAEYSSSNGNILVLDSGSACLKEYTPAGEYIRQISRRGNGPGELSQLSLFFFQMGGNTLIRNASKQGFVVFDDSLNFMEELSLWPQNPPMQCAALSDSTFAAYTIDYDVNEETGDFIIYRQIVSLKYGNEDFDSLFWVDSIETSLNELLQNTSVILDDLLFGLSMEADSNIVLFALKDPENYIIHAWHPDGSEAFTIDMPLEPVRKTEEEIAIEKTYMEGFLNQMGAQGMTEYTPQPYRDMVVDLFIGPDGNLWVQRGTSPQPFFDIYDMEGSLTGHKVFPKTGWTWHFSMGPKGILAWEDDPELGYQQIFVVQ